MGLLGSLLFFSNTLKGPFVRLYIHNFTCISISLYPVTIRMFKLRAIIYCTVAMPIASFTVSCHI